MHKPRRWPGRSAIGWRSLEIPVDPSAVPPPAPLAVAGRPRPTPSQGTELPHGEPFSPDPPIRPARAGPGDRLDRDGRRSRLEDLSNEMRLVPRGLGRGVRGLPPGPGRRSDRPAARPPDRQDDALRRPGHLHRRGRRSGRFVHLRRVLLPGRPGEERASPSRAVPPDGPPVPQRRCRLAGQFPRPCLKMGRHPRPPRPVFPRPPATQQRTPDRTDRSPGPV